MEKIKKKVKSGMKTQGIKGERLPRINMAFTQENYIFLRTMAAMSGESVTTFANCIIAEYKERHGSAFKAAQDILKTL